MQTRKEFSFKTRGENIDAAKFEEFDLCIIGGGINGAGVARDAASRGMKVCLLELADFAEGTSSRSSKLIHGGIRYLENFDFHLVFEALSERKILFDIAPHLVHPLRFALPLYKNGRVGMFKMGLGMWLYDILSKFQAPKMHEKLNIKETIQRFPTMQSKDLLGSFVYSDAYMDDDRLVLETLRSANSYGATICNFVKATGAEYVNGKISRMSCRDIISGEVFKVKAKHFVSTVGPWTDEFASTVFDNWKNIMRPSKGIHLTFKKEDFPLDEAVVMAAESRIIFAIPRHDMNIVGTTDTDYSGVLSEVKSDVDDVRYLFDVIEEYFPKIDLKKSIPVASYAGIRPLVEDGSATEGKTSREHLIHTDSRGVTFVAGGKYTTYRLMAEQTVDAALESFNFEERTKFNKSKTKTLINPLSTSDHREIDKAKNELKEKTDFSDIEIDHFLKRFSLEAVEIMLSYGEGLSPGPLRKWLIEARFAIEHTMCMNLKDFYMRRTPLFLAEDNNGFEYIDEIADIFSKELDWNEQKKSQQVNALHLLAENELSWKKQIYPS